MNKNLFRSVFLSAFLVVSVLPGLRASALNTGSLPVEAGFGQSCSNAVPCKGPLFCHEGKCVDCATNENCDERVGETCVDSVCTLPGGNNAGDFCGNNNNCKEGLECGAQNTCAGTAAAPTDAEDKNQPGSNSGDKEETVTEEENNGDWTGVDLTIQDVADIINGIACWLTRIAFAVMVIFLVISGIRFMNARGNPAAFQAATKNFYHVLVGILVIMGVYVIIATVANIVGRSNFSIIPLVC